MPKQPLQTLVRHLHQLARPPENAAADDQDLLARFVKHRDSIAFAALVQRHGLMVRGVCKRLLRQESDVDDAFQATFLVLLRKAHTIRKRHSLASWLYGVAFRIARRARKTGIRSQESGVRSRRSEARSQKSAIDYLNLKSATTDPSLEAAWRELCAVLDAEVHGLPEKYRAPLVLCYLEGQTRDQAARQLGWSLRTLDRRLEQGRERLRARLARRGITLSAALLATGLSQQAAIGAVPAVLIEQTVQAACGFACASSSAAACGFASPQTAASSPKAIILAEAALKGAVPIKLKIVAGIVIAAVVAAASAGALAHQMLAAKPQTVGEVKGAQLASGEVQAKDERPKKTPTDRYGDPLPEGAVARLGTVRFNHGDGLNALYFSPASQTIISEGGGVLRLWDAVSGKELRQFATAKPSFDDQTALSPDGKTLISLNQNVDDTLRVWDLAQGKEVRTVTLPVRRNKQSVYRRNALSRDGRLCALHTPPKRIPIQVPGQIRVFDISTDNELYQLPINGDEVRTVIFAGNDHLVTADKKQMIRVWEARTGKPVRQFAHGSPVEVLASSPDGRRLATLEHHNHAIDRMLDKDLVQVWDLTTGVRKHTLAARPKRWYMNMQFGPDGKFLFTSSFGHDGNELTVWDLETGQRVRELGGVAANTMAVSPDGSRLAAGASPGKFDLRDLKTGQRLSEDGGHARAAAVFPSADRVFTIGYSSISAWDATTGERLHSLDVPYYSLGDPHPRFSPDERYALSFEGDFENVQILVWDVVARRRLHTLRPPGAAAALTTAFSPDSSLLAAWLPGKETVVRFWDVRTGKEVRSFKETKAGWPGRLFFTPDGRILFVAGKRVVGYQADTGNELFSWRMKPLPSNSVKEQVVGGPPPDPDDQIAWRTLAFSPEGRTIACILAGGDFSQERVENRIVLCDARTGKILRRCNDSGKPSRWWEQLAFSQDGRLLASSDGSIVHVWEVATAQEIRTYKGHRGDIESLGFSANGRRLASASSDSTVLIWDLVTLLRSAHAVKEPPGEKGIDAWWADLAANDARRANEAVWQLAEKPSVSVPFIREHLKPVTDTQAKEIRQYIDDLDNNSFAFREKAFQNLKSLGPAAAPALSQALEKKVSLEARRRLEQLVESLSGPMSGESLRTVRALAVLEHAATPEARRVLQALADGASEAWLTQEAKATVGRLARRPASTP
jgi:RNA polymerase sigma factor (sigma-70 family)